MTIATGKTPAAALAPEPVAAEALAAGTALGQARGLGSAREGARHWGEERFVAALLLALIVWLAVSLVRLPALDHQTVTSWLRGPLAAVPMLLLVAALFRHLQMGLLQVIEDYAHDEGNRLLLIALVNIASLCTGAFALFAVLKIALGGDAP
jgi:succinate dehydrogenase / fumarate reductase membrane anchor subunit